MMLYYEPLHSLSYTLSNLFCQLLEVLLLVFYEVSRGECKWFAQSHVANTWQRGNPIPSVQVKSFFHKPQPSQKLIFQNRVVGKFQPAWDSLLVNPSSGVFSQSPSEELISTNKPDIQKMCCNSDYQCKGIMSPTLDCIPPAWRGTQNASFCRETTLFIKQYDQDCAKEDPL